MINHIREYLFTVTAAAIFCSILTVLIGKKTTQGTIIKLLTGLFMTITIISPWKNVTLSYPQALIEDIKVDSFYAVEAGTLESEKQIESIISQQTETYIMDKAASLGLVLTVDVALSNEPPALPQRVTISGDASPYAKQVLSHYIETNLNIPEEDQVWI